MIVKFNTKTAFLVILLTLTSLVVNAQVVDDFSDGDFTVNPTWSGTNSFEVIDPFEIAVADSQLKSQGLTGGSGTRISYLRTQLASTLNLTGEDMEWSFRLKNDFTFSGTSSLGNTNQSRVYLVSNASDLSDDTNGYYIQLRDISNGDEEVRLYRQTGGSNSQIVLDGSLQAITSQTFVSVRVTRSSSGLWEVFVNNASQGTGTDATHTTSDYFGVQIRYSANSRSGLFYFDDFFVSGNGTPLAATGVFVKGNKLITVSFNQEVDKSSSENTFNYTINNDITVRAASKSTINNNEVLLETSELSSLNYNLTIENVEDQATGTPSANSITLGFDYLQLELNELTTISETELQLSFNDELDKSSVEMLPNYSVDNAIGQPNSATIDASDAKILNLTFDNSLQALTDYTLTYGDINNDLLNSQIANGSTVSFDYVIPLVVESVQVLSKNQLKLTFNLDLDKSTAEQVSNYLIDNDIGVPQSALLDDTNLKEVTLSLQSDLQENTYTITLNNIEDKGNHPISSNTVAELSYLPLTITEISVINNSSIDVTFNQDLYKSSAETIDNYFVDFEVGTATLATLSESDEQTVKINFGNPFVNNDYTLTVNGVGNSLENASTENVTSLFEVEIATDYRQIVINEIFADPTPSLSLPSSEFVELHNVSERTINIGDFDLTGGTISDFSLSPGGFVILTSTSDATNFDTYENVVAVSSWNTLSNGGEQILLSDNLGNLVDSISFSDHWHESTKSDGGWTLEQINPELVCNYQANWASSMNFDGGTPGSTNSAFDNSPDEVGPNLTNVVAIDPSTLKLSFDEPMDQASLSSGVYSVETNNEQLTLIMSNPTTFTVDLKIEEPLISGSLYQISVSNVTDCANNPISVNSFSLDYDIIPPLLERIIISSLSSIQLVFDEGLEEKEAEDEDNFVVNNELSAPKSAILDEEDPSRLLLSFDNSFVPLVPNSITISNLQDAKGNSLSSSIVASFLYDQSIDTLIVRSVNQLDIVFNELVDKQTAIELSNYSISEDIGTPSLIYQDENEETLYHLIFEINFEDNSELILTIKDIKSTNGEYIPTPEYEFIYDTRAPKVLSVTTVNETTLQVNFDEQVEVQSAESIENYYYENVFSNTQTLSQNDSTVTLEFAIPFERERVLELSIDNVQDLSGTAISARIKKEFVYDVFPPELDSILAISSKELLLQFNEGIDSVSATNLNNYIVRENLENPASVALGSEMENQIVLTFSSSFPELPSVEISISALEDLRGNKLENAITATFDYSQFLIGRIRPVSQNQIEIEFNKPPKETMVLDVSNYSVNQGSVSQITNPDAQNARKFLLEIEKGFEDGSQNTVTVSNLTDENDNPLSADEYSFSFESKFSELRIINENTLELEFEIGLSGNDLPDKSNFVLAPNGLNPLALIVDSEDNKLLRLTFNEDFESNKTYVISWPQLKNEFGNLIPAFSREFIKDESAPEITKINVLSEQSISIVFSETLDQNTTDITSNYSLSPTSGVLEEVVYNESDNSVTLHFSQSLVDGTVYSLISKNIKDESGNLMLSTTTNFTYNAPYIPKPGELLFTELMLDPSPTVGLPEVEYLEVFNNSEEEILLNKLLLSDGSGSIQLTNDTLAAKSYLLLVSNSAKGLFSIENVVGISNFPSLGNASDSLVISLEDKTIIDQVVYSEDWYRDENKNDGGYALERLSFEEKCVTALNWIASADAQGGTPGKENSLFNTEPDKEAPEIEEVSFASSNTLEIIFSEAMDFESLENGSFLLNNDITIEELIPSGKEKNILTIIFTENPKEGKLYELTITNVADCAGNKIEPFSFKFGVGENPTFNELIITEIMADPDPEVGLPQSEYLELYNASDKNLELLGLTLKDENGSSELPMTIMVPNSYLLLVPSGSIGLFDEIDVRSVASWRSLSNSGETISIYNNEELVFSTSYDQSWYKNSSKESGGWSLEMIDINNPCGEVNNWTASEDPSGGTPGLSNSVVTNNPDNLGPQLVMAIAQDLNNLKLVFDEKLNPSQFANSSFDIEPQLEIFNFYLNEPINNAAFISTSDPISSKVEYTITTSTLTDCVGNFIRNDANKATFSLPETGEKGDIVINEVLFNPRSGGVDFVEVYNTSDKAINLKNWQLANYNNDGVIDPDIISEDDLIFQSGQFLVFTSDPVVLKADYPTSDETTFVNVSPFPGYSDSDGSVILLDSLDNIIDLFDYDGDFHFNLLDDVDGVSLERINFDGNSNEPNNWKSAASTVGFATPGLMNSQFMSETQVTGTLTIEPKVFVPDNRGMNDFTTINYEFQNTGNFANVNIYDAAGRLVRTIVEGGLLSTTGFFTWDGTDNSGSRARVGYYAIYFEIFDSKGNKNMMKETVVLGARF